jgi:hypothetical protein
MLRLEGRRERTIFPRSRRHLGSYHGRSKRWLGAMGICADWSPNVYYGLDYHPYASVREHRYLTRYVRAFVYSAPSPCLIRTIAAVKRLPFHDTHDALRTTATVEQCSHLRGQIYASPNGNDLTIVPMRRQDDVTHRNGRRRLGSRNGGAGSKRPQKRDASEQCRIAWESHGT